MAIEVMRVLLTTANHDEVSRIRVEVNERVAGWLNNRKRKDIAKVEDDCEVSIQIEARSDVGPEHLSLRCEDEIGKEVKDFLPVASQRAR
jgi:ribonuclease E